MHRGLGHGTQVVSSVRGRRHREDRPLWTHPADVHLGGRLQAESWVMGYDRQEDADYERESGLARVR